MTIPTPHVWHDHDGSPDCPLPVGTLHRYETTRRDVAGPEWMVLPNEDWTRVTRYRVHSYPEGEV